MYSNTTIILVLAAFIAYLNVIACYHIFKSDTCSHSQKKWQALIVMLVPFFGAVLIIAFYFADKEYISEQKAKRGFPSRITNFLTLTTFAAGYSGAVAGMHDAGGNGIHGHDGGGSDGGGGDGA